MKLINTLIAALIGLSCAFNASADVTGGFKGVSFSVTSRPADGRRSFHASGGKGTLKNENNVVVAQGDLKDVENDLTIKASVGATFVHKPNSYAFTSDAFSNEPVKEFAAVELCAGNQWTLRDDSFLFVLDLPDATQPRIEVALDKSLARASSITLPKGTYTLWGYTVTVEKAAGTVKFAHGKIVDANDATTQAIDIDKEIAKYTKQAAEAEAERDTQAKGIAKEIVSLVNAGNMAGAKKIVDGIQDNSLKRLVEKDVEEALKK